MPLAPLIALSHGGGPLPLLGDPNHKDIIRSLTTRVPRLLSLHASPPAAILVITAHWSTETPHISSGASHPLLYDYGGFPPESYQLRYPARGAPEVAARVRARLEDAGFAPVMDEARGWDHGVFVPMLLADPEGTVPVVQMSVLASEDPAAHLRMGRALHALRAENVAVVGSGFASFHNLGVMFPLMQGGPGGASSPEAAAVRLKSAAFNKALTEVVLAGDGGAREEGLRRWRAMESAYDMHPRGGGEHFLPLVVCAGAVGEGETGRVYSDGFVGVGILTFYWGAEEAVDAD